MRKQLKPFFMIAMSFLIVTMNGFYFPARASAEPAPEKRYLTVKYDNFAADRSDVRDNIPDTTQPWLQRNGTAAGSDGLVADNGRDVLRLTPALGTKVGSAFYGRMISLAKDRSFSTYFTFRMHDNIASPADGIVFTVQTLSKEAGASGGGIGYSGLQRSFGIEFDTYANSDANSKDPKASYVNPGGKTHPSRSAAANDTSHIAIDANGNVDHNKSTTSPLTGTVYPASTNSTGAITATAKQGETTPVVNLQTYDQSNTDWGTNNSYPLYNGELYHAWIVYDGPTDTVEVYLGKNAVFDESNLKLKKSGLKLREYLEQDEAYAGFTAATGGSWQAHDIVQWYFNNNSVPIEPANPAYSYEVAPPLISITGQDYIEGSTTSRTITAQLKNYDGTPWDKGPYPVTFSLFKEGTAKQYVIKKTDGSTQTVWLKPRTDDSRVSLKGETKGTNSENEQIRYVTVMSDANGVATTQLSTSLNTPIPDSNVKAVVGDTYGDGSYGGGAYDEKPVTFDGDTEPPHITNVVVDTDNANHVAVMLNEPVAYPADASHPENWDPANPTTWGKDGFTILIPNQDDPQNPIRVPATIIGGSGQTNDPLLLELADGKTVPQGTDIHLEYDDSKGTVQDEATNKLVTLLQEPADYPFSPSGAAVANDQERKTVALTFDFPVLDNQVAPGSFILHYANGTVNVPVTSVSADGVYANRLILKLDSAIPAGAEVTLDYTPPAAGGKVTNVASNGTDPGYNSLKPLNHFTVGNQMTPTKAAVIDDNARNKVTVSFASPIVLQGDAESLADAFGIVVDGLDDPLLVSAAELDSTDASGKTLILTLDSANLPEDGIPYATAVKLNYDSTIAGTGVKESGGSERSLQWLSGFPVENQILTVPNVIIMSPGNGAVVESPVTAITGTSDPGTAVTVEVKKADGSSVTGTTVTDPVTGAWTFTPDQPLAGDTYTVHAVAVDGRGHSGTDNISFTVEPELTYSILLTATPDHVVADGKSISVLTAAVTDSRGNRISGVNVDFSALLRSAGTPIGSFVDDQGNDIPATATTVDGVATIKFKAGTIDSTVPVAVDVKAEVHDAEHAIDAQAVITMVFEPTIISGYITDGENHTPVVGATVTLLDANGQPVPGRTTITGADGKYSIPVTEGNIAYWIEVTRPVGTGSGAKTVTYKQKVVVSGTVSGTGQEFVSDQTIAGIIAGKQADGTAQPLDFHSFIAQDTAGIHPAILVQLQSDGQYIASSGGTVSVPGESDGYAIDGNGVFTAGGLTAGKSYELEVRYYYDVKGLDGTVTGRDCVILGKKTVTVSKNGEMNITEELIDPFGVITDSVTHAPVKDAEIVLKYADSPRNRNKGILPGTIVVLPGLPGFLPADNANPQQSDANGSYAFMVYGDTDYYIEAAKAGYQAYRSPIIGVDHEIVRWNFTMTPDSGNSGNPDHSGNPGNSGSGDSDSNTNTGGATGTNGNASGTDGSTATPPSDKGRSDVSLNLAVARSSYKEGQEAAVVVQYANNAAQPLASGTIRVTLPEGAVVTDAAGGTVTGSTIAWEVKDVAAGQNGSLRFTVKLPALASTEGQLTFAGVFESSGELEHPEYAKSSLKVLVFSDRYGEIEHTRYILGYPSGSFKPQGSLTRAELAAIIARLINGGASVEKSAYADVPAKHWASGYIRVVTDNGIFTGFEDGSFRPDLPVTREELAAVMARYLKLDTSRPIAAHFADTRDRWSAAAIDALYRNAMVTGYPDGTFHPGNSIIRSEAVALINHMLFRGPLTGVSPSFPDVSAGNWAFGDVEEATRSHRAARNEDGSEAFKQAIKDNVQ